MTSAARSIYSFGLYLIVLGSILIGSPNTAGAVWTHAALRARA